MEALSYYAGQSPVTEPGELADRLPQQPDVAALQRVARGLVLHYRVDDPAAHGVPDDRLPEVDTRDAQAILQRLVELDGRPLTEERPPQTRVLGCCRDVTVLFLAMARHVGLPARARVGFATYFVPGLNVDHEVAEVWDADRARWRLVDPELGDDHADPNDGAHLDPLDLPRDRFLVAGSAWQACRTGRADPGSFLVDPELDTEDTRGWPQLRHNLVHDLAALNKREMLLWDAWGLMEREQPSERDLQLLDHLARTTLAADPAFDELRRLHDTEPDLRVPATVISYSPAADAPRRVVLRFLA